MGKRYTSIGDPGGYQIGFLDPVPSKPAVLLDGTGKFYTRSKPQYELLSAGSFIVVTDHGVSNDGTGDQTNAINMVLSGNVGWSQIMASGDYFSDEKKPQVVVRFGHAGDVGTMEVSDFLFTVKGPTAGAVLVEWNVREKSQGAVAMWDCHFRVGGAIGSDLQFSDCPKLSGGVKSQCKAASLLLHITSSSSGYFENVWAWTADHDLDLSVGAGAANTSASQVDIYSARGVLIESPGPVWLYGTASEHNAFYQYQFSGVFTPGTFNSDPTWADCDSGAVCVEAWALRVLHSSNIYIYGAGFYNFFNDYTQDCLDDESCQERIIETSYVEGLWMYELFTKGATQPISPQGDIMRPVLITDPNVQYAWLALSEQGGTFGDDVGTFGGDGGDEGSGVVYIDPSIWNDPNPTAYCIPPCIIVLPPKETALTYTFPPITTTIPVFTDDDANPTIVTTTITLPPLTTTSLDYWNINITTLPITTVVSSSIQPPPTLITETPNMVTSTFYPPPYPTETSSATRDNPTITIKSGKPEPTSPLFTADGDEQWVLWDDVDVTDLTSCYDHGADKFDPDKQYSTADNICFSQGDVVDDETDVGGYCTIVEMDACSIVLGIADEGIGPAIFSGAQLATFLSRSRDACGGDDLASVVSTTSSDPDDQGGGYFMSFCLVHPGQESACGTNQGIGPP
ncbi:hypothetical protein ONZ43_g4695 [Nemania bipapillata]|uniref:Uncharacterized protein n=1 Tax=Nemania bipapillata TaxID=110536 RepID=A0ACC2IJG8_9PEZI|nr:hypothetical protein ONZ43_g4695 [Nemania bipapillata]